MIWTMRENPVSLPTAHVLRALLVEHHHLAARTVDGAVPAGGNTVRITSSYCTSIGGKNFWDYTYVHHDLASAECRPALKFSRTAA